MLTRCNGVQRVVRSAVPLQMIQTRTIKRKRGRKHIHMIDMEKQSSKYASGVIPNYKVNEEIWEELQPKDKVRVVIERDEKDKGNPKGDHVSACGDDYGGISRKGLLINTQKNKKGDMTPTVRLMDYTDFKNRHFTKRKEAFIRSFKDTPKFKEIKFSCNILEHDVTYKVDQVERLLRNGHHVQLTIFFKPPLPFDAELGDILMNNIYDRIEPLVDPVTPHREYAPKMGEIRFTVQPKPHVSDGKTRTTKTVLSRGTKIYRKV